MVLGEKVSNDCLLGKDQDLTIAESNKLEPEQLEIPLTVKSNSVPETFSKNDLEIVVANSKIKGEVGREQKALKAVARNQNCHNLRKVILRSKRCSWGVTSNRHGNIIIKGKIFEWSASTYVHQASGEKVTYKKSKVLTKRKVVKSFCPTVSGESEMNSLAGLEANPEEAPIDGAHQTSLAAMPSTREKFWPVDIDEDLYLECFPDYMDLVGDNGPY